MPTGSIRQVGSAVLVGTGPATTQQITVDNSVVPTMRAAVGTIKITGTAPVNQ